MKPKGRKGQIVIEKGVEKMLQKTYSKYCLDLLGINLAL